ncbi:BTAD domain-containing putative transcriptional regulator [Streptomyces sp. NPDC057540]|uniref:AfsR/SARP family transcriptional regulator n=1 Tax=Streptomyces sp. NPDC057540 TaxID=3346160 RepID=UPI00369713F2
MGERLDFGILGPLVVGVAGRTLPPGGARQRTVLALLLLSPGRIVPLDVLVHEVWGDQPPATARTQIAIVVAALRKAFRSEGAADEVIVTAHPGYLLRAADHRLDSTVFTELVADAEHAARERRPADAARRYTEALALWRGAALAGVSGRRVEDEAARWEELRLHAQEALTGVRLELGHHRELLPELASSVRQHPLRERARHQLVLAQYRCGRRAEALETLREGRRRFVDELGMEPGRELQDLHDAILRDDPSLAAGAPRPAADVASGAPHVGAYASRTVEGGVATGAATPPVAPEASASPTSPTSPASPASPMSPVSPVSSTSRPAVPSELPADVPGFAGRETELASLDALVDATGDDRNALSVGLITGVAGVGKTGLAVRWAHRSTRHYPDGRLFADLRGYDEHHAPTAAGEILSRFLRSLGMASEDVPDGLEDRIALYRSVLADRRVLLVLDNVRTPEQIRPLLAGGGGCTVLVTSREQLEQLVTWPPSARIHLGLLPEDRSLELLGGIVGEDRILGAPAESARLVELCDRLPLALRIAAARLASKPHWTVRHLVARLGDERRRLDELSQGELRVRAGFAVSYRYLDPDAARLYRLLGLLAVPDFTTWVAAALLDSGEIEAERLVEHLVDAQFLGVAGVDATGRLRYRFHDLMRLYAGELARAEESEADRSAACDRVFRAYLTIAEIAYRREHGGDGGNLRGDVRRRDIAPALVEELLPDPMEWFEAERLCLGAVVEQSVRSGAHDLAWDLVMSMRVFFESRNYLDDWRTSSEHALAAARTAGNLRGQAAMHSQLGVIGLRQRDVPAALTSHETAFALFTRAGDPHGRALVLNDLGLVDRIRGEYEQGERRLREALDLCREVGDHSLAIYSLHSLAQYALDGGRLSEALDLSREAVEVAGTLDVVGRSMALATYRLAGTYLALGRLDEAEEAYGTVVRLVEEKADLIGLAYALMGLAETRLAAGAGEAAERTYLEALDFARRRQTTLLEGQIRLGLGRLHHAYGRPEESRVQLVAALAVFRAIGSPPWEEKAADALALVGGEDSA